MIRLRNGTVIIVENDKVTTRLPCGKEVIAKPEARTPSIAAAMGCSPEELTMTHDPVHSTIMDALGAPYSFSLMQAAGEDVDPDIAALEEDAVLAFQRLRFALRKVLQC